MNVDGKKGLRRKKRSISVKRREKIAKVEQIEIVGDYKIIILWAL